MQSMRKGMTGYGRAQWANLGDRGQGRRIGINMLNERAQLAVRDR